MLFADLIFDFTSSEKIVTVEKTSKTQIAVKKKVHKLTTYSVKEGRVLECFRIP
jgi:hypothetical protein